LEKSKPKKRVAVLRAATRFLGFMSQAKLSKRCK